MRLAVEVLSPNTRKPALQSKINIYAAHGIEAWLVDPKQQEVKVDIGGQVRSASLKKNAELRWNGKSFLLASVFHLPG